MGLVTLGLATLAASTRPVQTHHNTAAASPGPVAALAFGSGRSGRGGVWNELGQGPRTGWGGSPGLGTGSGQGQGGGAGTSGAQTLRKVALKK